MINLWTTKWRNYINYYYKRRLKDKKNKQNKIIKTFKLMQIILIKKCRP